VRNLRPPPLTVSPLRAVILYRFTSCASLADSANARSFGWASAATEKIPPRVSRSNFCHSFCHSSPLSHLGIDPFDDEDVGQQIAHGAHFFRRVASRDLQDGFGLLAEPFRANAQFPVRYNGAGHRM
jgi:hypothetical protein